MGHIIFRYKNRSYYITENMKSQQELEEWLRRKIKEDSSLTRLREIIDKYNIFQYDVTNVKKPTKTLTMSVSRILDLEEGEGRFIHGRYDGDEYNMCKFTHSDGSVSYQEHEKDDIDEDTKNDIINYIEERSIKLKQSISERLLGYPNLISYIDRGCTIHHISESSDFKKYKENKLLKLEFEKKEKMTAEIVKEFIGESNESEINWIELFHDNQLPCEAIGILTDDETVNSGLNIRSDYGYLIDLDNNYYVWTGKYTGFISSSLNELKKEHKVLMHNNDWRQELRYWRNVGR